MDPPSVVIRGLPSAELAEKIKIDEEKRIAAQIEKLGPEGLANAAKELQEAQAEHDKPIPQEVLKQFPVPNVNSISWIDVQSHHEGEPATRITSTSARTPLKDFIEKDGEKLPFFVGFDHVKVCVRFFSLSV